MMIIVGVIIIVVVAARLLFLLLLLHCYYSCCCSAINVPFCISTNTGISFAVVVLDCLTLWSKKRNVAAGVNAGSKQIIGELCFFYRTIRDNTADWAGAMK